MIRNLNLVNLASFNPLTDQNQIVSNELNLSSESQEHEQTPEPETFKNNMASK